MAGVKVRIGVGVARPSASPGELETILESLEQLGFDSIWLPDVLQAPVDDPLTALAFAAAHVPRLKLGTTLVLPGRNPVRLARELATLDRLSQGRLLVTVVPGIPRPVELAAMGLAADEREAEMDELLPLVKRLLGGTPVDHHGARWSFEGLRVEQLPVQEPFDIWVGGTAPRALRRAGTVSDGWLPSMCTPEEAGAGRTRIEQIAADAGRRIDPEHFGVSIGYRHGPLPARALERLRVRAGADVERLVPDGTTALRSLLEQFVDHGISKFVVRPVAAPGSWAEELGRLADAVLDLQR